MSVVGEQGGHVVGLGRGPDAREPGLEERHGEREASADEPKLPPPDPNRIGIVFVHGIGSQKPGETLVSWARPLLRVVTSWSATTTGVRAPNDPVTDAEVDFSGSNRPFIRARVPGVGTHDPQEWVMTEAWWSTKVSPPSIGDMFRWLFPMEMGRIIFGIFKGLGAEQRAYRWGEMFFLVPFVIPLTILVFFLYVTFRLLRIMPIKQVQEFAVIRAIEFFLSDWFGDVRIMLADRAQAANVRAAIASAIESVTLDGCGTVVVIGHSGGTIAGYMTLADDKYAGLPVHRFITHGQALGLVWRLGHACEPTRPDRRVDRLYRGDRLRIPLNEVRPGLEWFDFWGTHDPAPAGGFAHGCAVSRPEASDGVETRVFNRMSLRNDHGGYWDNDEGFVLPVARLIETSATGQPASASRFFPSEPTPSRVERRERRVKLLQYAWVGVMVSAVLAVPLAIVDPLMPGDRGNLTEAGQGAYAFVGQLAAGLGWVAELLELPKLPSAVDGTAALVIGLIAMLAVYVGVARFMGSVWNAWDAREREIALQPKPVWRPIGPLVIQLGLSSAAAVSLLGFAASGSGYGLVFPALALGLALLSRFSSSKGMVRRPGRDEVGDRDAIIAGEPGVAEV